MKTQPESACAQQLRRIEKTINASPDKALRALRALRKKAKEAGESDTLLNYCDLLMGRCMQRSGRGEKAYELILRSTQALDAANAAREAATGYHYLSQLHAGRSDYQSAHEYCLRGQEIARRAKDWYLLMSLHTDLAPVYRGFNDFDASIKAYKRALDILEKHVRGKDERIVGQEEYTEFIIQLNIAIQYLNKQAFSDAKKCLDCIAGMERRVLGGAYQDLYNMEYARACFGLGLDAEGLKMADTVTARLENDPKHSLHGVATNYISLGKKLVELGENARAGKLIALLRPIVEENAALRVLKTFYMVAAAYDDAVGDKDAALSDYRNFVKVSEKHEQSEESENRANYRRRAAMQKTLRRQQEEEARQTRQIAQLKEQMRLKSARESILSNISENTNAFYLLFDPATQAVEFFSQNCLRLFGLDLSAESDPLGTLRAWLNMPATDKPSADYQAINPLTGAALTVHQEIIALPGQPCIMVLTDVTREKELNASLITAIEAAKRANEAKTRFFSNMSHDIRTPLNGMIGLLEMLRDHIDDRETALKHIADMEQSSRHLMQLINNILDITRIESGQMTLTEERFTLDGFLDTVMTIMRPQAQQRGQTLSLDMHCGGDKPLLGDSLHMRQIFLNILGNAVKFTPKGGSVALRVYEERARRNHVAYRFAFEDTGCGMSPEFMEKLFTPFERAEGSVRAVEGSGLGMAITKSLVDMMKGGITVESAPGAGTTFTLYLYLKRDHEADAQTGDKRDARAGQAENGAHFGEVLLVEDNALNVTIAEYILEKLGCRVCTVNNGQEALDLLLLAPPARFSIVFMDVRMPVMDGYEATRRIRALDIPALRNIPIVAMTADAFDEDIRLSQAAGMNAHIAKPLDAHRILSVLERFAR